ncbi:MAG: hypothetical protein K2J82_06880 [Muribaculaceae bacterium]|nr:hypothetical protein [Muribaculaceae bacterium]MDE6754318.1 hypothetical protein [Muribaculaceae bacterium]
MRRNKDTDNGFFWLSYSDLMTSMFFLMFILFIVGVVRFSSLKTQLKPFEKYIAVIEQQKEEIQRLTAFKDKYEEIMAIYKAVDNIDPEYFEFNKEYLKHIFRIQVTYQTGKYKLNELRQDASWSEAYNPAEAETIRKHVVEAGEEIKRTIMKLQENDSLNTNIKYLVVVEGQASADGYNRNEYLNNNVLSYQRALSLHEFWRDYAGIDFTKMPGCELVIAGSGEGGVPRAPRLSQSDDSQNQRFLIHIVPVIGDIHLSELSNTREKIINTYPATNIDSISW